MPVLRPTIDQLQDIADTLGFAMSPTEAATYREMLEGTFAGYDVVDRLPDPIPESPYGRTAGRRPDAEANPHNAWTRRLSIKGRPGGPLAGKRVALKDSICLAGVPMAAGAGFLEGFVPEADATVVTRILDAGGEVVGKAQCEYLCSSGGSHTSWPAPVLNPRSLTHSAGGSSSGSAALIAAGEADLSLGGDQGGSIRIPAAWCGIVGMKPTYGLIPYTGMFPIEWTIDHTGPMSADVADNALLLEVVAGPDGIDPRQANVVTVPYRARLADGVRGLRIGVVREGFGRPESEEAVDAKVRAAATRLASLGAIVSEISIPVHAIGRAIWAPTLIEGSMDMMMRGNGAASNHGGLYLAGAASAMARWRQRADEISVPLKVVMLAAEHMARTYGGRFYGKSQNLIRQMRGLYDAALAENDLLLMPTTPQLPTRLPPEDASIRQIWDAALAMNGNTAPFCGTGHPSLTVPCGAVGPLPVGMMLTGRHWDECSLYRAAYAFEQSVDWQTL